MKSVNKLLLLVMALLCPFLSKAQCTSSDQLQSSLNHTGNGQRGIMFDVEAINAVSIQCFETTLYSGTARYEIYYKVGTHVGFQNTASAWTKIGSTVTVTSRGSRRFTPIPIAVNLLIPAGQTYAFYITNATVQRTGGIFYTNGGAVGATLVSDANLEIKRGRGKAYPFAQNFTTRNFNGRIRYNVGASITSTKNPSCSGGMNGEVEITTFSLTPPYTVNGVSYNSNPFTITGLAGTNHTFNLTDNVGKTTTLSTTLTTPAPINTNISGVTDVSCTGATDGTLTVSAAGGSNTFEYSLNGALPYQSSNVFTNLGAGSYVVTVKDGNNCAVTTAPMTINEPTAISASATIVSDYNGEQVSCVGATDGQIIINASGGTGALSYSMNGGVYQSNNVFQNLGVGTYTFTVKDANNCTTTTTLVTINAPTAITATAMVTSDYNGHPISCVGATDGTITITASNGTGTLTYSMNGGAYQSSNVFDNLGAGAYTFTIKDANNCTVTTTAVTINAPTAITATAMVTSDYNGSPISYAGATDGIITVTANGGTGNLMYSMNGGAYQSSNVFDNLGAGTYTFTIKDVNNCTVTTLAVPISAPTMIVATAMVTSDYNGSSISCVDAMDGSITVTATNGVGNFTYNINGGAYQNSNVFNNLGAGTYTFTAKDANNGIVTTTPVVINAPTTITATATISSDYNGSPLTCHDATDGEITVMASGGTGTMTYSKDGTTYQSSNVFTGFGQGTHTLYVKDANGCTMTVTETITMTGLSTSTSSTPTLCNGSNDGTATVVATNGTAPYTYKWDDNETTATIINKQAGTYNVTVTDVNGCSTVNTATITEPTAVNVTISLINAVSCNGGNDAALSASATGGTPNGTGDYTYTWSNNTTGSTVSGLSAGTYHVTATDANGCTDVAQVTITEPMLLTANIAVNAMVSCNGGNDGSLTVTASGGTGTYQYSLNGGTPQNTGIFTGLPAQNHTVVVTDANNCSTTVNTIITQPTVITVTASSTPTSCNNAMDGSVTLTVTGGTPSATGTYSYVWSDNANNATTANLTGLEADIYTVTVTDANNCTAVHSVTVTAPNTLSAIATQGAAVSCNGGNNGSATITATGGTTPYSYVWENGEQTAQATILTAGTYTPTITDANGCTTTATVTITEPTALNATASTTTNVLCSGGADGSTTVAATDGTTPYTYAWNNGATTANLTNVMAGIYTVTVTDANGCAITSSTTVTEPTALQVTSTTNDVSCNGGNNGSATLMVTGGMTNGTYTYNWDNGATTASVSNLSAGTYTATITDANNCTVTHSVIINEPTILSAIAGNTTGISCFGATDGSIFVSVQGGTTPYTYNWSNGATTANVSNLGTGTYTVTVTDANNCPTTASTTIIGPTQALAAAITNATDVTCNDANDGTIDLTVSGGVTPYTYSWTNGATTEDLTDLDVGSYSVTVTDASGCMVTIDTSLSEPAQLAATATPSVTFNGYEVSCNGAMDGAIDLQVTGGTPMAIGTYTYAWATGETTEDLTNLGAGTYSVTVTDANNCSATTSITLTEPSVLSATITNTTNITCNGANDGSAMVTATGGVAPYHYAWDSVQMTSTAMNLTVGSHTVTVTDANGCTVTATATISEPTMLSVGINTTQSITCNGGTGDIASIVAGGTAPYAYSWSNGVATADLTGVGAGTYALMVTDANGCTASQSITLTEPVAIVANINSTAVSCNGQTDGSVDLTVSGGIPIAIGTYTFAWDNNQTTEDLTGLAAGSYTVTITDANGCTTTATATVAEPATLTATAMATDATCNGGTGSVNLMVAGGTAPYTYAWDNNSTMMNLMQVAAGTYNVTVMDANGCTATSSAVVSEPTTIAITSTVTDVTCNGQADGAIMTTVTGGTAPYIYSWDNGSSIQNLANLPSGNYTLTVTDANGCTATDMIVVGEPAILTATGVVMNVTCDGQADGAITTTVTGGTAPYTYSWSNATAVANLTNVGSGSYSVTVTDANGCQTNATFQITAPVALSLTVTAQAIVCNGGTASLNSLVSGGTAPYTVSVTDANGTTVANPNSVTAGTYTVSVTDANGCSINDQVTLTEPTAIAINSLIVEDVLCAGEATGSILLDVTGGAGSFTYNWSTNQGINNNANNLTAGSYSVTVTDFNGCTATGSFTINEPAPLTVSLSGADDPNNSGKVELTATAGGGVAPYTYSWSGNAAGQTGSVASNIASGVFTVVVTDANGCSVEVTETVIATSTETLTNVSKLNLFPNPTVGQATIELELTEAADVNIAIHNVAGIKVQEFGNEYTSQARHQIDLTQFAAGVYLVRVTIDSEVVTKRLVVVRP